MKYLDKTISSGSSVDCTCWVIIEIKIDTYKKVETYDEDDAPTGIQDPDDFKQPAHIWLNGYVNKQSWLNGEKPIVKKKHVFVEDISTFTNYQSMVTEVLTEMISSESTKISDSTFNSAVITDHETGPVE